MYVWACFSFEGMPAVDHTTTSNVQGHHRIIVNVSAVYRVRKKIAYLFEHALHSYAYAYYVDETAVGQRFCEA